MSRPIRLTQTRMKAREKTGKDHIHRLVKALSAVASSVSQTDTRATLALEGS